MLERASLTFYRSKDDPRVFTRENCRIGDQYSVQSVLTAFEEFMQSPPRTESTYTKSLEYIQTYLSHYDIPGAARAACDALNQHILTRDILDMETSTIDDFDRWFIRKDALVDIFSYSKPELVIENFELSSWVQVFYDLVHYQILFQMDDRGYKSRRVDDLTFLTIYIMSFADETWKNKSLREGCRILTDRALAFLTRLTSNRIMARFSDFISILKSHLNRKHINAIRRKFPEGQKHQDTLQEIMDRDAKWELLKWLKTDLTQTGLVEASVAFSWNGFAQLIETLSRRTKYRYQNQLTVLTEVVSFLGTFVSWDI